jgi:hypothetical protein|tara:strand:+ start:1131 stop:1370 length:240 start_codon:yes stop_codon:yes gene_type:complete
MPSLDFVYDLVEKLEEDNIQYLVLALRDGKLEDKIDVFFNLNSESEPSFLASIDKVKEVVKKTKGKNAKPKRTKRKKKE